MPISKDRSGKAGFCFSRPGCSHLSYIPVSAPRSFDCCDKARELIAACFLYYLTNKGFLFKVSMYDVFVFLRENFAEIAKRWVSLTR